MDKNIPEETQYGYLWLNNTQRISLFQPEESYMDIETIANALSHICRFTGQLNCFYSVAQHSVLVSHLVPIEFALTGLMHDATESFCTDLPKPIKQILPEYSVIEDRFWAPLADSYDLPRQLPECIHIADRIALITESRDMQNGDDWKTWAPDLQPLPWKIVAQLSSDAYRSFMERFNELTGSTFDTEAAYYEYA